MNSKSKDKQRTAAGYRVLSFLLSLAVAVSPLMPNAVQVVYAAERAGQEVLGTIYGTAEPQDIGVMYETAENDEEDAFVSGGAVSLFQSAEGEDLRTYATQEAWYLGIASMEDKPELVTEKMTTDYNGTVKPVTIKNSPSAPGLNFVIVNLALTKTGAGGDSFKARDLTLTIGDVSYPRVLQDSFLTDHGYASFSNTDVIAGSQRGDVVFEVPEKAAGAVDDWKKGIETGHIKLQAGGITGVAAEVSDSDKIAVPMNGYLVDSQFETEKALLKEYREGSYGIENPFFVPDPYGKAPLTGIAMFHTDEPADVIEVTVAGKQAVDPEDITYEIETSGTEHQVPVFGFYPQYQNAFSMTARTSQGGLVAASGTISNEKTNTSGASGYVKPSVKVNNSSKAVPMQDGLTLLMNTEWTVVDAKGDVRWYQRPKLTNIWGINELTERGTFYFADEGGQANPSVPEIIYEMNYSGKIIAQYLFVDENPSECIPDTHHDGMELPGTNSFLYLVNSNRQNVGFKEVDKITGAVVRFTKLTDIMNQIGIIPGTPASGGDWAHINTIKPTEDGNILMSLRNQSLLLKYNYKNNKILWAMSQYKDHIAQYNPGWKTENLFITLENTPDSTGGEAEYTKQQHDVTEIMNWDDDPNTEDILVYDNGMGRGNYSRIVHYQINLKEKTARQIYSAGKSRTSFYGEIWGSSQYLPETQNYIGGASSNEVTEFSSKGAVVWSLNTGDRTYRSYRLSESEFVKGFHPMGTLKGKAFMRVADEIPLVKTEVSGGLGNKVTYSLNESKLYVHENQLRLAGSAYRTGAASKAKTVYLVADDGMRQYYAPLTVENTTAYTFDNTTKTTKPLSTENLPNGSYRLGFLVKDSSGSAYKETNYYIEKTGAVQTVQTDDDGQREIVEALLENAQDSLHTINDPVVAVNPFGKTPLSAAAAFHTAKACDVKVTVQGRPASGEAVQADVTYTVSGKTKNHVVPIIGLFANYTNTVRLEADGMTAVIRVTTGEVNPTYAREAQITSTAQQRTALAYGLTFLTPAGAQTIPSAIDVNGELRWAYVCPAPAPLETKPLKDGHFLVPSDRASTEAFTMDSETALEIDLLGRIYGEYYLDGLPHHEVFERENGNLIFALSRRNHTSTEDYMAEVDRETGRIVRTWDIKKILGIPDYDPSYDPEKNGMNMEADVADAPHRAHPNIKITSGNHAYSDWFHQNSLSYSEGDPADLSDDAIYVTGRHQSMLVKINAEKGEGSRPAKDAVEWIYTDPSWKPQSTLDLDSLILKPEGAEAAEAQERLQQETLQLEELEQVEPQQKETPDVQEGDQQRLKAESSDIPLQDPVQTNSKEAPDTKDSGELLHTGEAGQSPILFQALSGSLNTDISLQPKEEEAGNNGQATEGQQGKDQEGNEKTGSGQEPAGEVSNGETEAKASDGELEDASLAEGMEYPYIYGPHAVERLGNGDFILYDNHLYGSKTQQKPEAGLFSRAIRLSVNEGARTFRIAWEYGQELGSSHYTPFIGDVDYLGPELSAGEAVTDDHYLVCFGGITKIKVDGVEIACDVMPAMLSTSGSISADIQEYDNGEISWSAYFKGAAGRVSSVYRAERVNLSDIPMNAVDYETYTGIENRGMYGNTPQVSVDTAVFSKAVKGTVPASWMMLHDEGNRLLGTFKLPHVMTDQAAEGERIRNVYLVLDLGKEGRRVYETRQIAASAALGVKEPYYAFEIIKDNQAAQIQLLLERNDGVWIYGNTGEVASASVQYITGEVPVIDPAEPAVSAKTGEETPLLQSLMDQNRVEEGTLLYVAEGSLEPGQKYMYLDAESGQSTDLLYSAVHGGYLLSILGRTLDLAGAKNAIQAVGGGVKDIRTGIVADSRNDVLNGSLRSQLTPSDLFYLCARVEDGRIPANDAQRTLAMDIDGNYEIDLLDLTELISRYLLK